MTSQEKVLVVPRSLFDSLGAFQGLNSEVERYLPIFLDPANHSFVPRSEAEEDPSLKQLIPYIVVTCGDRVLQYRRGSGSGETRLLKKRSLGIGGHINDQDGLGKDFDAAAYERALLRELEEELNLPASFHFSQNLSSKSTDAANNCVVPVLASSSINYTLSRCAPSTPCSSSACNSLAPARLAPKGLPSAVDPAAATPHVLATLKTGSSIKPLALLNDDSNPVGEVHLGVVHQCELLSEDVTAREEAIAELGFFTDEELQQRIEEFESWSQIVIRGWRELQH